MNYSSNSTSILQIIYIYLQSDYLRYCKALFKSRQTKL